MQASGAISPSFASERTTGIPPGTSSVAISITGLKPAKNGVARDDDGRTVVTHRRPQRRAETMNNVAQDDGRMVTAAEIPWTSTPVPRIEGVHAVDLTAMTHDELLVYAGDCREEIISVRELLYDSIAMNARQTDELKRAARIADHLRIELRAVRDQQRAAA
jgi:hypothetical protein